MTEPRLVPKPGPVCEVRDGRFITPCVELASANAARLLGEIDARTGQLRSSFVALIGSLVPFRHCPFCGSPFPSTTEVVQ